MKKERFGEYLMRMGLIDEESLKRALEFQEKNQMPIGQLAMSMGFIPTLSLERILKKQATDPPAFRRTGGEHGHDHQRNSR